MPRSFRAARFCRSPLAGVALVVFCLLAHWPGSLTLPPVDRDESRFAQAMRQVAEAAKAGDWAGVIVPHIQDRPRINKPPLVYWLAIPSSLALDHPGHDIGQGIFPLGDLPTGNIFAYRLVSLLSAMVAVLLTWRIGLALRFHPAAAWLGAMLLAACVMVSWDARQARADQTLLACTTGAMLCLAHLWRLRHHPMPRTRRWIIGLIIWVALGVLAKGIAILIVGLAATSLALWSRGNGARAWVRHLRAPWVVIASLAPIAAWFIAARAILGTDQATSTAAKETIWRALIPQESHWGPPGYHLVLLAILFFPGCLATATALGRAFSRATSGVAKNTLWSRIRCVLIGPVRARIDDRTVFCLAWIVLPWIMFELAMTKLPHYTLPVYPAIALLSARELLRMGARKECVGFWGSTVYVGIALVIGVVCPVILTITQLNIWLVPIYSLSQAYEILLITLNTLFLLPWLVAITLSLRRHRPIYAVALTIGLSVLSIGLLTAFRLPNQEYLWVSSRLAGWGMGDNGNDTRPLAFVGYQEDSLIFLTCGRIERVGAKRIHEWFEMHPDGMAFIQRPATRRRFERWDHGPSPFSRLGSAGGFNYSTGQWVAVDIIVRTDPESGYDSRSHSPHTTSIEPPHAP